MTIKWAPPWLKALGSRNSPLVDDAEVQAEVARLKVRFEREERQQSGELFAGPMAQPPVPDERPRPLTEILPPPTPDRKDRFDDAVQPTADVDLPPWSAGTGGAMTGGAMTGGPPRELPPFVAPPEAPPPPVDRPPGTFQFLPYTDDEDDEDDERDLDD